MTTHQAALLVLAAKFSASTRRNNNAVHRAADASLRAATLAVAYGFGMGRKAVDKAALRRATTERQAHEAMDAAPAAVRAGLKKALPSVLAKCFAAGANAAMLPRSAMRALKPFDIRFDQSSPEAIAYAKDHVGELIDDLSATTISDIQDAIVAALEGDGIGAAYDDILDAVGDSDRAAMIARTETMAAANEGQQAAWEDAADAGLLPQDASVEWTATSDCCDDCADMGYGETRPLDGEYDDADYADGPPAHPNCRCTEGIGA